MSSKCYGSTDGSNPSSLGPTPSDFATPKTPRPAHETPDPPTVTRAKHMHGRGPSTPREMGIIGGKPSKGTKADKRLGSNKGGKGK